MKCDFRHTPTIDRLFSIGCEPRRIHSERAYYRHKSPEPRRSSLPFLHLRSPKDPRFGIWRNRYSNHETFLRVSHRSNWMYRSSLPESTEPHPSNSRSSGPPDQIRRIEMTSHCIQCRSIEIAVSKRCPMERVRSSLDLDTRHVEPTQACMPEWPVLGHFPNDTFIRVLISMSRRLGYRESLHTVM